MSPSPFAPLTPEQLAEHRAKRAAGEAEIARKEAALAEAEARLDGTKAKLAELEADLKAHTHADDAQPGDGD